MKYLSQDLKVIAFGNVSASGWDSSPPPHPQSPLKHQPSNTLSYHATPPAPDLEALNHPRLRRASRLSHFLAIATENSIQKLPTDFLPKSQQLAIIHITKHIPSPYFDFLQTALPAPPQAKPNIFPETVYNATTSHVAATITPCSTLTDYTLIADDKNGWTPAIELAHQLLQSKSATSCLLLCGEEASPFSLIQHTHSKATSSFCEGAAALWIQKTTTSVNEYFIPQQTSPLLQAFEFINQLIKYGQNK